MYTSFTFTEHVLVTVVLFSVYVPVIFTVPAATPVSVVPETVPYAVFPDVYVTPDVSVFVELSLYVTTALSVAVAPASILLAEAVTLSEEGTTVSLIVNVHVADSVLAEIFAVITAVPFFTAVTLPAELTVATDVSLEVHVTAVPAGVVEAVSCTASSLTSMETLALSSEIEYDCATVIADDALFPFVVVAVIVALPVFIAVTTPVELTVATDVSEEAQVTAFPDVAFEGVYVTLSVSEEPTVNEEGAAGDTEIAVTGISETAET